MVLSTVTSAMNAAATEDVRAIDTVPLLKKLLKGTKAPNQQAAQMLQLLIDWRHNGGNRLDLNGDGEIDDPGAAIMDTAWPKIANRFMKPQIGPQLDELNSLFSRFDQPPGGQYSGWYQYFDRDIRRLLHMKQPQPFVKRYCGAGNLRCQDGDLGRDPTPAKLPASPGHLRPERVAIDATAERISFVPGLLKTTMAYTNRPSGIQQVISFNSHR